MYYNNDTIIYFNGKFVKAAEAGVDLYGQSLHYGYAIFEGIKSYKTDEGTKIFKPKEHFDRLRRSAELMHMPFDYTTEQLTAIAYEVLERNNFGDAYLRPLVICSPNMSLSKGKESYLTIQAWEWSKGYLDGRLRIMTGSFERPNPKAFKIEAKVSGHYVNSILACQEAKDMGYDEALVLDSKGFVAESSGANVFFEKDGVLYTPAKGSILPGITRATVLDICRELDIPAEEKFFTPAEMRGTDAAFFCGTAAEIVALESLDDVPFTKDWDTTHCATIQKAYQNLVLGKTLEEFKGSLQVADNR
jgi:branched-chain amino acid aminotransferase